MSGKYSINIISTQAINSSTIDSKTNDLSFLKSNLNSQINTNHKPSSITTSSDLPEKYLFLTPLLAIKSEDSKKNIVFPLFKEENIEQIVNSIETITKERFISCQSQCQSFDRIEKKMKINEKDESSVFVDSKNRVGLINKYVKSIGEVVFGKEDCLRMYFDIN